jgi:hypothetical protein
VRDKCYLILSKSGQGSIRVRAGKKPDARTTEALRELFDAAQKHLRAYDGRSSAGTGTWKNFLKKRDPV